MTNHSGGFLSPLTVGLMAGVVLGAAAVGMTSERSRSNLKRHAKETVHAMGSMATDLADMVRD